MVRAERKEEEEGRQEWCVVRGRGGEGEEVIGSGVW